MTNMVLYVLLCCVELIFGIMISFVFSGVKVTKKSIRTILLISIVCFVIQASSHVFLGETSTSLIRPFIVHLPTGLVLITRQKKRPITVFAAVLTAYLCCQPARWFGVWLSAVSHNEGVGFLIETIVLILCSFICVYALAPVMSRVFNLKNHMTLLFSLIPLVFYIFDYSMEILFPVKEVNATLAIEFLAFALCIFFLMFCIIYYAEFHKRFEAEKKEQVVYITFQQQAHEVAAIRKSVHEIRLLRHDMRLLLESLSLSIQQDDKENSLNMISGFINKIDATVIERWCNNDTLNYIITNFKAQCIENKINFEIDVEIEDLYVDEISFASIISNALDNALKAQEDLPPSKRKIKLLLKTQDDKLLLSVRNYFKTTPIFDGEIPTTDKAGHGLGTQSIRYMTEKLGGKSQFLIEDNIFVLRVVI